MTDGDDHHSLTVVVPAYNEEEAIGDTVSRCVAARDFIVEHSPVSSVEIVVVSDGSTDRTAEIVRQIPDVSLIEFEKNRGYGAAIKEGFRQGTGDFVGFLDGDGTCDPKFFATLCTELVDGDADVSLGSRMGPDSQMPFVRRVGNVGFALLLGVLCGRRIQDTASGMRVIRREALPDLYPLPDGLHFTPAMSTRAILNGVAIRETPMPYEERVGDSKLSVFKDGARFLRVIIEGVLCYRPERLFLMGFAAFLLVASLLASYPTEYYLQNRSIEEWMIYRFVVCFLLGAAGFLLLSGAVIAHEMAMLGPTGPRTESFWASLLASSFRGRALGVLVCAEVLVAVLLLWPGIVEYATTRHVNLHWSRVVVGAFCLLVAFQSLVTGAMLEVVSVWRHNLNGRTDSEL